MHRYSCVEPEALYTSLNKQVADTETVIIPTMALINWKSCSINDIWHKVSHRLASTMRSEEMLNQTCFVRPRA